MSRYTPVTTLPDALHNWSAKSLNSIPHDRPPCGFLPGADEENRVLASIFAALCAWPGTTERLALLASAIVTHERRLQMAWDAARGRSDSPRSSNSTDRSAMVRLRPYESMVDALKLWMDELHESAMAEIGVQFIEAAAKTRIAS